MATSLFRFRAVRGFALAGVSVVGLCAFSGALMAAENAFVAPAKEFGGMVRASAATQGAPIIAGAEVVLDGQGFIPGQRVTFLRGSQNLTSEPVVADGEGKLSLRIKLPADAASGMHPVVMIAENPSAAKVVDLKISPVVPLSGEENFTLRSAPMIRGLYQAAVSDQDGAIFVTSAVGRPPVKDSALLRIDPKTLEITARGLPETAPQGPGGREGGVFAVYGVDVDDANQTVWVTNTRQNTVAVYRQSDLSLVKQFEPGAVLHSRDVLIDEARGRAYVSSAASDTVEVFDTKSLEKVATIKVASARRGQDFTVMSLAADPDKGLLYTVSLSSGEAAVIDMAKNEVVKVLPLPGAKSASGVAVDPGAGRLFVASQQSDNLLIVDLDSGKVLHDVAVGAGALNVAFDAARGLAYVANRGSGTITVVDGEGRIVANLDGGTLPNHVATDGKGNIYAVNKSRGENDAEGDRLTVIAPNR